MPLKPTIWEQVTHLVRNFPGREYSGDIEPETLFFEELGFVSIDAVVLGEMLETHFNRKLPYSAFLSELAAQGAKDIRVGQLVAFVEKSLAEPNPK